MNENQQKVMPLVNIKRLFAAHLIVDEYINGEYHIEYQKPRYLEGIKQLGIKPKENTDPYYHEGRKILDERTLQDVAVTVNITDLRDDDDSYLMGHKLAETGGVIRNANDKAPVLALLYEAEKSEGILQYGVLYAGTFGLADEDIKAKEGKSNFQAKKLQASFRQLKNGLWNYKVSSDSPHVTKDFLDKFFDEVVIPKVLEEVAPETPTPEETAVKDKVEGKVNK